jgi:TPR repeat protein
MKQAFSLFLFALLISFSAAAETFGPLAELYSRAERKDSAAEFSLAMLFSHGRAKAILYDGYDKSAWVYAERNPNEARKWLNRALEHGFSHRTVYQGFKELGVRAPDGEIKELQTRAEQGNSDAQLTLASVYFLNFHLDKMERKTGFTREERGKKGLDWLLKSAEQNNVDALLFLAYLYFDGAVQAIKRSDDKAIEFLHKAANLGSAQAYVELGNYYLEEAVREVRDFKGTQKWYQWAVEYFGEEKEARDFKEAHKWYQLAAEQNAGGGQYGLGRLYQQGYGFEKDYVLAAKWFRLAAENGWKPAMSALGQIYAEGGFGVESDFKSAQQWYQSATNPITIENKLVTDANGRFPIGASEKEIDLFFSQTKNYRSKSEKKESSFHDVYYSLQEKSYDSEWSTSYKARFNERGELVEPIRFYGGGGATWCMR